MKERSLPFLAALLTACGAATPPAQPAAPSGITVFEVALVSTTPASGAALLITPPNDTPIDLSATFSVSVPPGQSGTYVWNTAVQAEQPLGFLILPIATTTFRQVPLVEGVQSVTLTGFRSTNAICFQLDRTASVTASLDVDIRAPGSSQAQNAAQVFGKKFPVTFKITCVVRR